MMLKRLLLSISVIIIFTACENSKEQSDSSAKQRDSPAVKGVAISSRYDNSLAGIEGMKNAVRGYAQATIDAYLSDTHIKDLKEYAVQSVAKKMFVFINSDRDRGVAMDMRLNRLVFKNISAGEPRNLIDTEEQWDFRYIDIKTLKPVASIKEARYKLRYTIVRDDDKWLISGIEEREKTLMGDYYPPRWEFND